MVLKGKTKNDLVWLPAVEVAPNGTKENCDYSCLSVQEQLEISLKATKVFFENQFDSAVDMCKRGLKKSLYHTLSYATMCWLKAWMTFEKPEIETAIEALKQSLEFSSSKKRRPGWFDYLRRTNYDDYTEEEIHAELAYADSLFMLSLITFIQDQNFMSLIKGGFRFRCGFQSYKICSQILEYRTKWESESTKREFESGVRAGNGSYNLALSMSPPRVLRILEFMGFSGDRNVGISELKSAAGLENTGRSLFATIMLLMNFMYSETMSGWGDKDWTMIDHLLDQLCKSCPQSVFRPLFQGKYRQLKGDCEAAIELFQTAVRTQDQWKQLHSACNWEIMWSYAIQCKWNQAAEYANRLRQESQWSPCTFTYQYAAYLYMVKGNTKDSSLDDKIRELIREVPKLKRRFAGKSTPREKFVCMMADRFERQNGLMVVPGFEVLYIWNIFSAINSPPLIEKILSCLQDSIDSFVDEDAQVKDHDGWGVLHLLKGVCLRHLNRLEESVKCLTMVEEKSSLYSPGHYLLPNCVLEIGIAYMKLGQRKAAMDYMERSINNYTKYSGELIVHVRAHFALKSLQEP